jgi:glycosyltransferase involved in cell wall biosynthesis
MQPPAHQGHPGLPASAAPNGAELDLTVLAPAHNEQDNVGPLVEEVGRTLRATGLRGEFLIVDDGSTDQTRQEILARMPERPWLRCVAMANTPPGRGNGQSAAFHAGIRAARGRLIAILDADLQNDPAEIPAMLELLARERADVVQGDRSHARQDNLIRKGGSWVGRMFRRTLLGDPIRDTGCSLRVLKREVALRLPLEFRGMHRFIPISAIKMGYRVVQMSVKHRPRTMGQTKYGLGIVQRALPGLIDLLVVRWMAARRRPVDFAELAPPGSVSAGWVEVRPVGSAAEARA